MSPLVRCWRAESAVSRLAAIESRRIDGASDPSTPSCAGDPTVARAESANRRMTNLVEKDCVSLWTTVRNEIAPAFDLREPLHRSRDKGRAVRFT